MANNKRCGCPHVKAFCFTHSRYKIAFMMKSHHDKNKYFASYFKEEKLPPEKLLTKMYDRLKNSIVGEVNKVELWDKTLNKVVASYKLN